MSYLLIGSHTSPFVRKLRLALHGRIDYELKAVNYTEEPGQSYLKSVNPINKLPVLLDNDQKIFDSRVIYNYLSRRHGWTPLTMDEENILSATYGMTDACANIFLMKRGGLDLTAHNWYVERQLERMPSILDYLKPWIQSRDPHRSEHWNFPAMSLFSFLYWAQFRGMIDLSERPDCLKYLEDFKNKPGIAETDIPK